VDVQGQAALVTGGASGLGLATARVLARAGARVTVFDLDESRAVEEANAFGGLGLGCNVADEGAVTAALAKAEAAQGIARIVVNCAGIPGGMRLVGRDGPVDMVRFAQVLSVNLLGTVSVMTKAAARMMAGDAFGPDGERGIIINTGSITAYEGQVGQGAYVASKGAIMAMTLQAAREFAARGVRVMAIAPGLFQTPMAADVPPEVVEGIVSDAIFPRRFGAPEDFADLVLSICRNPMLNGEVIRLDAGVRLRAR
jgi:NAD(P)-dependent dehydrogenase (short-subunit alcohol dehydrogenase family)